MEHFESNAQLNAGCAEETSCKKPNDARAELKGLGAKSVSAAKVARMVGGTVAMTLVAAGMAHAAGSEIPDGYMLLGDNIGLESVRITSDGSLLLTFENGETRTLPAEDFIILDDGRFAVSEAGMDAVLSVDVGDGSAGVLVAAGVGVLLAGAAAASGGGSEGPAFEVVLDAGNVLTLSGNAIGPRNVSTTLRQWPLEFRLAFLRLVLVG
jgi:hypothetical protein